MKWLGFILIITGSTCLGLEQKRRNLAVLELARELLWLLHFLKSCVLYEHKTILECFKQVSQYMLSDSLQQATLHITEKMEQIEPALYARLVRGELAEIAGNNRELQQICRIFSQGFCDQGFWIEEQQLMSLERASEQLQERLKVLEYKMIEKNRMIVWISLLSGGFICIVLA